MSHLSAAALWGVPLPFALENQAVVHLTRDPGRRAVRYKNVVGHQQSLEPDEIVAGAWVGCTSQCGRGSTSPAYWASMIW